VHLAALRFLYTVTLHRPGVTASFRQIRVDRPAPDILSTTQIERLLAGASNVKHRGMFMLTYATRRVAAIGSSRCRPVRCRYCASTGSRTGTS